MDINIVNRLLQQSLKFAYVKNSNTIAATIQIDNNVIYTEFYVGSSSIQISMDGGDTRWNDPELEHFIDQYNELFAPKTGFKAFQRYDCGKEDPQLMFDCVLTRKGSDEYSAANQIADAMLKLKHSGTGLEYLSTFLRYIRGN